MLNLSRIILSTKKTMMKRKNAATRRGGAQAERMMV